MTKANPLELKSGRYSKLMNKWSLIGIFAVTFVGMIFRVDSLVEIIAAVSAASLAHNTLHRAGGWADLRTLIKSDLFTGFKKASP